VPLEVVRFGHRSTAALLAKFGRPELREIAGQPFVTDSGNFIYDLACGPIESPALFERRLRELPGVVETGLFCARADVVIVAGESGVRQLKRSALG
jgi:ribose 5-phosphate isomerase A